MNLLTPRRTFVAGVAIILIVNAIALGGVAYNRSGSPDSTLHLSQRELSLPYAIRGFDHLVTGRRDDEDSGIALTLEWRVPFQFANSDKNEWPQRLDDAVWLDVAKLNSLGFDVSPPASGLDDRQGYRPQPRRAVLVVLELDGPAYRQSLVQAALIVAHAKSNANANPNAGSNTNGIPDASNSVTEANKALIREEQENSRLFAVDAGLDAKELRAKYPDRSHYAIVHGTIRPQWTIEGGKKRLSARIDQLSANTINIPKAFRPIFESSTGHMRVGGDGQENTHPFVADVAFGKRFEPWIVNVNGKR